MATLFVLRFTPIAQKDSYTVAIASKLLSAPGPGETSPPRVRSVAACDSDLRCRCSPEAQSLDRSNRVGTGSYSPQPVVGCSDTEASDPNPPPTFVGAFLWPCRCRERCTDCRR